MALTIKDADKYISLNVIDIDDWVSSDDEKKTRVINVANTTLKTRFRDYIAKNADFKLPDEAVYDFCGYLAVLFNDQNKHLLNGVSQISASGIASIMYKQSSIKTPGEYSLADFIPQSTLDIVSDANGGLKLGGRTVKSTVI